MSGYHPLTPSSGSIGRLSAKQSENTFTANESGFSLIELAVSIIVIAALVGFLLKGQDIVQSARIHQTAKHIKMIDAAFTTFVDEYNEFPGDISDPERIIPDCTIANECLPGGNGNGQISQFSEPERLSWYTHLQLLGLLPDEVTGSYIRITTGNRPQMGSTSSTSSHFRHKLIMVSIFKSKLMERLDKIIDDGKPKSGRLQTASTYCIEGTQNIYILQGSSFNCTLEYYMKY